MKFLFVGDMHFRQTQHHAADFDDKRVDERKDIESAIVKAAKDCDVVVLGGDVLDARDNPSSVIRSLVSFLERFGKKQVFLLGGNHDSDTTGRCALDFIREISDKPWTVVHGEVSTYEGVTMVPYFRRAQFDVETDPEVVDEVLKLMPSKSKVTILHHAIAGTATATGMMTDTFQEPVFHGEKLLEKSERVLGCHIHKPADIDKLQIVGSIMNHDISESDDKRVLKWDSETDKMTSITLPGRKFLKLVNPTKKELEAVKDYNGLVKVISDKPVKIPEGMAEAVTVVEMPKSTRKKVAMTDDYSPENLLKIYSEARDIPLDKLLAGWQIINE